MRNNFTKAQIEAFVKKASEYDSEDEFLVGLKAVKINTGHRSILFYEGLQGTADPITGEPFPNNTPYTLYAELLEELYARKRKKEYAEKMKLKALEETAKEQGF